MMDWSETTWNEEAVGDAMVALARAAGFDPRSGATPRVVAGSLGQDDRALHRFIESAAEYASIEAEPIECTYGELSATLASMSPALVRIAVQGRPRYLAVLRSNRRSLLVVTRTLGRRRIRLPDLHQVLTADMERVLSKRVDGWLSVARVTGRRAARAKSALLTQFLSDRRVGNVWLLRPDPGSSFVRQLRLRGALRRVVTFVAASLGQVVANVVSWALIGNSALNGFFESGWLFAGS